MGLIRSIKKRIKSFEMNRKLGCYKYIHIMFNDKFNKPFVDFLNKNFDKKEHLVLCKRWFSEHPFPDGENVIEINFLKGFNFHQKSIEKLIFHSLFDEECIDLLYEQKELLNKSYWYIWGGDLYRAKRNEKHDYVLSNFKGYINQIDEKYAKETYGINKNFFDAYTPAPGVDIDMLNCVPMKDKSDKTVIQINHDCDPSTIDMLKKLSFLAGENVEIRTTVSYGFTQYKDEIILTGKNIFGDKFKYLDIFLDAKEYLEYINQNDVLIFNQNYQQGLANIFIYAYLGKKIFIKSDVSTYRYLLSKGMIIYDTNDIKSNNIYNILVANSNDDICHNRDVVNCVINKNSYVICWNNVFDS